MGKSSNHKKENTFKFQTFSERIASVNIDVIHQIRHHDDTPEETGTYFGEALDKQLELNFTDHFTNFKREISQHVQTYAQLVHHEDEIVEALKKHLVIPDSMAIPALLDLLVQLARDLQTDFYRHFKDFFDLLVQLLSRYTQDSEILESTFVCLSYIFKFLWRYLVKDIRLVFGYFSSLLGNQYKEYVQNFAAESFAFLMRKVKDPSSLFDFMFISLQEDPDKSVGVGRLMFEMMKGVKKQFHSCSLKIFPLLLSKLGPQDDQSHDMLPWELVETALSSTMSAMANYADSEHLEEMWGVLLNQLKSVYDSWLEEKKKGKKIQSECLERLLRLTVVWVNYKNGGVLGKPDTLAQFLLKVLRGPKLPNSAGEDVLGLTSALLLTSYSRMAVETTRRLIPQVYKTEYPLELVFNFTSSLYELPIFEKDVLPSLLPYCQTAVSMDTQSCDLALLSVTEMLLEKAPVLTDGSALDNVQTYMLDFGTRCEGKSFPKFIVSLLECVTIDGDHNLARLWSAMICLPHVRPLQEEKTVHKKLSSLIQKLTTLAEKQDKHTREKTLFVVTQALVAMVIMLDNKDIFDLVPLDLLKPCLINNFDSISALRMADVYFTHAAQEDMLDLLSLEMFGEIFPVLQNNLSSPHPQDRLLTLRIFSSFSLPPATTDSSPDTLDVFTICLNAEKVPSTVHDYRQKLLYLRKLEYSQVQNSIPVGPYHQVPLRYLIGCLFVNFKLLWEPVCSLVGSHAHNMETAVFWEVFTPTLLLAAEKSEQELASSTTLTKHLDDSAETPSGISDLFSQQLCEIGTRDSRLDFTNFRFLLWKSMQNFPEKCEAKSRDIVPLFFRFLEKEYYFSDMSVAPTQNLLRRDLESDVADTLVEEMETDDVEVPSGEIEKSELKQERYSLRSLDTKVDDSDHELDQTENLGKRIRTRSQCSNSSDVGDLVSVSKRKADRKTSESGTSVSEKNGQSLRERKEKLGSRPRTRSQCSNSDLEELDYDMSETSRGKGISRLQDLPREPTILEEEISDSENRDEESPKKKGKKGEKKMKKKDKTVDDDTDDVKGKEEKSKGSGKKDKAAQRSLIVQLELFSKFRNPAALFMEGQLRKVYFDLLLHKNAQVQKTAFQCIMTYKSKYKYLSVYQENFERLMEDNSFKNEIVLFNIDSENGVVSSEHRADVLEVLMRLLYGKMHVKTGKGTSGKQHSGVRQAIVLRFLNGCKQNELETFVNLVFAPFQQFITKDADKMVRDLWESSDLTSVIPVKRLQGVLYSIDVIFKKLGHLLDSYLSKLIQIIVGMATVSGVCLANRKKIIPNVINPMKNIRQLTIYRLIQIFRDYDKYEWKTSELDAVFDAVVWPQLEKLPNEGIYHPTPLLKLLSCWSKHPRYFKLLAKHKGSSPEITPLPYVLKLLHCKEAARPVKACIMDIIENLLLPLDTESLDEVKVVEVNHMVKLMSSESVPDEAVGIRVLLPHISSILSYIEGTIDTLRVRLSKKMNSCKELQILSRISKFVRDSDQSATLVKLLLPFMGRKFTRPQKTEEDILSSILNLMKLLKDRARFFPGISQLFSSLTNRMTRSLLCDLLMVVSEGDDDLSSLALIVSKINSWDKQRMEEPDYMLRLEGFTEANGLIKQMVTMETDVCLAVIYNCCYFITAVDDMSLRDNSTHSLVTMVTQFGHAEYEQGQYNRLILQALLPEVKMGLRNKQEIVRHEFTTVLMALVDTFGDKLGFSELKGLRNEDIETDFFENINHIQMHRRSKALGKLIKHLKGTKVRPETILSYFLPLVTAFLTDDVFRKHHSLLDAAVVAVGSLCQQLPWKHYLHQLKHYLQLLPKKFGSHKLMVRVIVSILDAFHFDLSKSQFNVKLAPAITAEGKDEKTSQEPDEVEVEKAADDLDPESGELETSQVEDVAMETSEEIKESEEGKLLCSEEMATKIHSMILNNVIAQLHKILVEKVKSDGEHKLAKSKYAEDDEILRVPIALAMIKLLQTLPKGGLERYLPGILLKVCHFLKSRATDIRNTARDTLIKILTALGPRYFPYILYEMKSTLKRGYQLHVLCYTIHQLLKQMEEVIQPGDVDICLKTLIEVCNEEIFGEVAEEKDVEGIKVKVFEARSSTSYDSYQLIASYISKGSLMTLVEPLKKILDSTHSHKSARRVQEIMTKVVRGLMKNKDITVETLLIFVHGLTHETLPMLKEDKSEANVEKVALKPGQKPESCLLLPKAPKRGGTKAKTNKKTNIHVMVEFGLQLLQQCFKQGKLQKSDKSHLEMLDPLVPMMAECLYSKYTRVNTWCLRSLCWLLKYPLPSLPTHITKIANGMFVLLRNYATVGAAKGDNMELVSMLFKAVTVLVRHVKFHKIEMSQLQVLLTFCEEDLRAVTVLVRHVKFHKIEMSQLQVLLTFCEEDLHDYNRQSTAFTLLKAILSRKIHFPEIHETLTKVEEMSITADSPHVRRECRQVVLQYLLDYPLGKKLQTHLEFYISQLNYEMEMGRESTLEMMATFFSSFPQEVLSEQCGYFFIPMSAALVNDDSAKCRKLTALAIKSLLGRIDNNDRTSLFSIVLKWLMDEKLRHRTLAAQLVGLFVEVEGAQFQQRLSDLLPVIEQQLEPGKYQKMERESKEHDQDHMLYNTLNTLIKVLRDCDQLLRDEKWSENMNVIWEHIKSHLSYPHIWVQLASSQLFGLLFAAWQPEELVAMETDSSKEYLAIDTASKLKSLAIDFVTQLQSELLNEDLAAQIVKNMLFLAKVAHYMDSQPTLKVADGEEKVIKFSIFWLVRKMVREAHHEAVHKVRNSLKRKSVYKWIAAVSLDLRQTGIQPVLHLIVQPLQRDINDQSTTLDPTLKSLAQEVLEMLKKTAGMEKFTEVYASTQKFRSERKDERKRKRAVQAVADPEAAAKKKIKKHLSKKDAKKRQQERFKPSKKSKKRRYEEFTVTDQD